MGDRDETYNNSFAFATFFRYVLETRKTETYTENYSHSFSPIACRELSYTGLLVLCVIT